MEKDFGQALEGLMAHLAVRNYSPASQGQYREGLGVFLPVPGGPGHPGLAAGGTGDLEGLPASLDREEDPGGEALHLGDEGGLFPGGEEAF